MAVLFQNRFKIMIIAHGEKGKTMRTIDADALEKELNNERERFVALDMKGAEHILVHSALRLLREAPTIDAVPRWIPCEERLPGDNIVLVTHENIIESGIYNKTTDEWAVWSGSYWIWGQYVTAWMPLPEPYVAERKDDD